MRLRKTSNCRAASGPANVNTRRERLLRAPYCVSSMRRYVFVPHGVLVKAPIYLLYVTAAGTRNQPLP